MPSRSKRVLEQSGSCPKAAGSDPQKWMSGRTPFLCPEQTGHCHIGIPRSREQHYHQPLDRDEIKQAVETMASSRLGIPGAISLIRELYAYVPQKTAQQGNFAYFLQFFRSGTSPRGFSRPWHRISRQKCQIWILKNTLFCILICLRIFSTFFDICFVDFRILRAVN